MATNITPPKVTGGGGFGFEDNNQQFSKDSAPNDFVTACWEIFLEPGLTQFDRTKDLLALATSPTDRSFKAQLDELLSWARVQTAADLSRRVATQNYGSDVKRGLLRSFT
jgi:hypothetical protein